MAVAPDSMLLHYRIVDKLGEGGMGAVWRAVDTTLDREVAIKLLPEGFASDTERVARFDREAKLLASLNHPNIAAVYSVHEYEGSRFITQELVAGEDLCARIARGRVERDEALHIALQILEGLQAAHERGIIHRDLKPANVMLGGQTSSLSPQVKILDFGLAKAFSSDDSAAGTSASLSPTVTSAGTIAGMILGTAGYMSPEQARGRAADHRSDIWSFGCVLFELLSGKRAFDGDTVSDALASVLKVDPDLDQLPADTPSSIRQLLRRCLNKDAHHRLHAAADARIVIDDVLAGRDDAGGVAPAAATPRRSPLLLGLGILAGIVLGIFIPWGQGSTVVEPPPVVRSQIPLPDDLPMSPGNPIAISPDGTMLALSMGIDVPRIYLRHLDRSDAVLIPGSEGGGGPMFSPDGRQLAFFTSGQLKKVSLLGEASDVTVLCDVPVSKTGAWDTHGWIYYTFAESRLARVREDGGTPEVLGEVGDVHHLAPLPDGRGILLTLQPVDAPSNRKDTSTIAVLDPDGKTVTTVLEGGYNARYLDSGHLLFVRGGGLWVVPLDLERLEVTGDPINVEPQVMVDSVWATARYDVSRNGTLAFSAAGDHAYTVPTWIDLTTGAEEPLPIPPGVYNTFDISPDGTMLAIQNATGAQDQIFVFDTRRGAFTRLTSDGANIYPVWSHDGREVFFASNRDGKGYRLYRKSVDGSGPATRLLTEELGAVTESDLRWPSSVTPDGRYLLMYTWAHPTRGGDLWKVPLDGSAPELVLATPDNEIIPQVSPDGNWLAYLSNSTGNYEIHVRPFPDVERREWLVSAGNDSFDPRWLPGGGGLLYRMSWGTWMEVSVNPTGDALVPGIAVERIDIDAHDAAGSSFVISLDGKRVLVNKPVDFSFRDRTPVTLVTGWGAPE